MLTDMPSMTVTVASGLLAGARGAAKVGKNVFQISCHCLNALALGSHREQLLLEIKIERQRAGEIERESAVVGSGEILHCARQDQNFEVRADRPGLVTRRRSAGFIGHEQHV